MSLAPVGAGPAPTSRIEFRSSRMIAGGSPWGRRSPRATGASATRPTSRALSSHGSAARGVSCHQPTATSPSKASRPGGRHASRSPERPPCSPLGARSGRPRRSANTCTSSFWRRRPDRTAPPAMTLVVAPPFGPVAAGLHAAPAPLAAAARVVEEPPAAICAAALSDAFQSPRRRVLPAGPRRHRNQCPYLRHPPSRHARPPDGPNDRRLPSPHARLRPSGSASRRPPARRARPSPAWGSPPSHCSPRGCGGTSLLPGRSVS
jgi:hypothetical protein